MIKFDEGLHNKNKLSKLQQAQHPEDSLQKILSEHSENIEDSGVDSFDEDSAMEGASDQGEVHSDLRNDPEFQR